MYGSNPAGSGSRRALSIEDRGSAGRLPGRSGGGGKPNGRPRQSLPRPADGVGPARPCRPSRKGAGPANPAGGLGTASAPPLDPRRPCALPVGSSLTHRAGIRASRLRLKVTRRRAAAGGVRGSVVTIANGRGLDGNHRVRRPTAGRRGGAPNGRLPPRPAARRTAGAVSHWASSQPSREGRVCKSWGPIFTRAAREVNHKNRPAAGPRRESLRTWEFAPEKKRGARARSGR